MPSMIPTPFSSNGVDVVDDEDDDDEHLQWRGDENVTSYGEDIFQKEFPVMSVSTDASTDQQQLMSPTRALMARLNQIRTLQDEYLAAEDTCAANPADDAARALRDKLKSQLAALVIGEQSTQASA